MNAIDNIYGFSDHGGLITYVRDDYICKNLDLYSSSEIWEGLFIEAKNIATNRKIIVCNIYRPPRNNNSISNISSFIENISDCVIRLDSFDNVVIAGDFNIDLIKIHTNNIYNTYLENFMSKGFIPIITKPTRFSTHSATLLDHIFTRCDNIYEKPFGCILTSVISDHFPVVGGIPLKIEYEKRPKFINKMDYSRQSQQNFFNELQTVD